MTTAYRFTATELNALAQTLIAKCERDGNLTFDGHARTEAEEANAASARNLTARIARTLEDCTPEETLALLDTYDLLHRVGYGRPPEAAYMTRQRTKLLDAWRAGALLLPERLLRRLRLSLGQRV